MSTEWKPAVSILLLSKDQGRYLAEALESALAQSMPDWEMVAIDNGSADASWDIIRAYALKEPRIKPLLPESRLGIAAARNLGLRQGSGRYVAPLDADDAWLPERLKRQMRFMEEPQNHDVGVCGANCLLMDANGRVFGRKDYPQNHEACVRAFWFRNPICHSASLIRRECFDCLGCYDEEFDLIEDLELWLRLGQHHRLANLPDYLVRTRLTGGNASLRYQRQTIVLTLRARRRAIRQYGYRAGPGAYAAVAATWLAQWLPARLVRRLFNHFFLPYGRFLWREAGVSGGPGEAAQASAGPGVERPTPKMERGPGSLPGGGHTPI